MSNTLKIPVGIRRHLRDAPTTDFVYSSLSFLRNLTTSKVPGTWFVAALAEIGIAPQTVRQTLFRLVQAGSLRVHRIGRVNWYGPGAATGAILDAGRLRSTEVVDDSWDGKWTLIHLRRASLGRSVRDQLRDVLQVHGFSRIRNGVYIHPRDLTKVVLDATNELEIADCVAVFRGERHGTPPDEELVEDLWDIPGVEKRYSDFIGRYKDIAARPRDDWSDREAFAMRFAYMFEFFRITWEDPSLPLRFLPEPWAGSEARRLAAELRAHLYPGALRFVRAVAERVRWDPERVRAESEATP